MSASAGIRALCEDMQTLLSVQRRIHPLEMLEEKLSCLLHFLKTSETCQGNNSHDTLLNTSNDNLPWERSHCVCAPFLWGVWKSAGALHPEPVGKSLASLCGSCALLLQQKPLLTANPAPSCFSTGDRSVVRCYKSADSPFCPASEWGSPLPSSRKEQFSVPELHWRDVREEMEEGKKKFRLFFAFSIHSP